MASAVAGALRETLTPLLAGADPRKRLLAWERVAEALPASDHPEFRRLVSAAVEMALIDLAGKYYNAPAYALLGGQYRDALPISWVAYIRSADELAEEIQEKVTAGFTAFKLKVEPTLSLTASASASAAGLSARMRTSRPMLRARGKNKRPIERIRELSALGVDAVETPIQCVARKVAKDHPEQVNADPDAAALALARVRAAVPAALIEHVADFDDSFALALLRHRAVDAFNVATRPSRQPAPRPATEPARRGRWRTRPARQHGRARHWHGRSRASRRGHQSRLRALGFGRPRPVGERCCHTALDLSAGLPARSVPARGWASS